ncbi:10504_t:CDS:2 [Gigaspora rosea]|nr:10504_t:CDS:2 [Gigaspora rosea]
MVNPISIRPLKQPFILVSYMNNTKVKEYWGAVLNWSGKKLSSRSLGQFDVYDYVAHDDNFEYFHSQNLIEINELGFLRAYLEYSNIINITQYSVDDNGNLEMLKTGFFDAGSFTDFTLFTSFAIIDERYAIFLRPNSQQPNFHGQAYASFSNNQNWNED